MEPGDRVDVYVIVRKIGEGGMSIVYRAEHREYKTKVVVKQLRQTLAFDEQLVQRFAQSAEIMQRLQHPHLARVLKYIEPDLVVEEYLSGGSLADLLDKGEPVSKEDALRWCRDALRAVNYAHEWRIIHRDLKPGNLMLDDNRQVKVTDFGIARVFGGPRFTKTGGELGTTIYMSPEQIRNPRDVYHLTDVYSMGVVLYELLTNRVPFDGQTEFAIKQAVTQQRPVPPRRLNRSISRDLERIMLRALEKRPENRFSGCAEFANELDRCLTGKPVPPGYLDWIYKHPRAVVGLLALICLALLIHQIIQWIPPKPDDMVLIPGGHAQIGPQKEQVMVPSFYIDRSEVSNGAYRLFCERTGRQFPEGLDGADPDKPVVNVSFEEAEAFARWAQKRLPTAVEWEKAARGPNGQVFPWGNQASDTAANVPRRTDSESQLTPVRSYPQGASPYGVLNLVGNVWEWIDTPAQPDPEQFKRYKKTLPSLNPPPSLTEPYHQIRGGSFQFVTSLHAGLVSNFSVMPARAKLPDLGFRCARSVH